MGKTQSRILISTEQRAKKLRALSALRWPLRRTWLGLFAERFIRAFWPLWSIMFVLYAAVSFGLQDRLTLELFYFLGLGSLGALAWFTYQGFAGFRWPRGAEVMDRLDRSLKGRPLSAMWDEQAIGASDVQSVQVWSVHVERMIDMARKARAVAPDLRLSQSDPFALRYVAASALVVGLLFGAANRGGNLIEKIAPDSAVAVVTGPLFEGWIEPPQYTGKPSIYLNDVAGDLPIEVPEGSRVTLRLYGPSGDAEFSESVSGAATPLGIDDLSSGQNFLVSQSGDLTVTVSGGKTKSWNLRMIADAPPTIERLGEVERTPNGEMRLTFKAGDDYGVLGGQARIELDLPAVDRRYGLTFDPEPIEPIILDIPLPYNGETREFEDVIVDDLAQHPWAGLPVRLFLSASDAVQDSANSGNETIILPGRRFFDPLAASIVELRRDLLWNRENAPRVAQVLRAVTYLPEDIFDNEKAFLAIRSAIRRIEGDLQSNLSDTVRDDVVDLMWHAALLIEEGDVNDAAEALRRAQERLSEAIENGATEEELAQLSDELRRAMQEYMEQLARDAEQNPDRETAQQGERREITSNDLQNMLDRIEDLARQGRNQEAQALLEQLRQMMENMEVARRGPGQDEGPGLQGMRDLQDTMRQQQELADEAFRRLQDRFNGNSNGDMQFGDPGRNDNGRPREGNSLPSLQELARRQEALRQLLENQRGALPESGNEEGRLTRDALRRAEREMGEAGDALRNNDPAAALDNQAEALEALREGIQRLGEDLAQTENPNRGRQGAQQGARDPESREDPLGRQAGTTGRIGSEEELLSEQEMFKRSQDLIDEIRRRSGQRDRPRLELDYLKRLLDRF